MNNTISVYDLLGLIKDGKAPKKIKYNNRIYVFAGNDYSIDDKDDKKRYWLITEFNYSLSDFLNEKVEIIDKGEDKPIIEKINLDREPLKGKEVPRAIDYLLEGRINEIIDYINRKEDK